MSLPNMGAALEARRKLDDALSGLYVPYDHRTNGGITVVHGSLPNPHIRDLSTAQEDGELVSLRVSSRDGQRHLFSIGRFTCTATQSVEGPEEFRILSGLAVMDSELFPAGYVLHEYDAVTLPSPRTLRAGQLLEMLLPSDELVTPLAPDKTGSLMHGRFDDVGIIMGIQLAAEISSFTGRS